MEWWELCSLLLCRGGHCVVWLLCAVQRGAADTETTTKVTGCILAGEGEGGWGVADVNKPGRHYSPGVDCVSQQSATRAGTAELPPSPAPGPTLPPTPLHPYRDAGLCIKPNYRSFLAALVLTSESSRPHRYVCWVSVLAVCPNPFLPVTGIIQYLVISCHSLSSP